jgi:hypothetical protein
MNMWAPHQEQDSKIKTSPKFVGDGSVGGRATMCKLVQSN